MKIFVVDDSMMIWGRIVEMLSCIKGIEFLGVSGQPDEAIIKIGELEPDMVILDIRLNGGSGIDVLQKIREENPEIVVVMLTNYPYPQYIKKCMDIGADYFFDKSRDFDKLVDILSD